MKQRLLVMVALAASMVMVCAGIAVAQSAPPDTAEKTTPDIVKKDVPLPADAKALRERLSKQDSKDKNPTGSYTLSPADSGSTAPQLRTAIANCRGNAQQPHDSTWRRGEISAHSTLRCYSEQARMEQWLTLYRYRWYGQQVLANAYGRDGADDNEFIDTRARYVCTRSSNDFSTPYDYRNYTYGRVVNLRGKVFTGGYEAVRYNEVCSRP